MFEIVLYDARNDTIAVLDNADTLEEAKSSVERYRSQGLPAFHRSAGDDAISISALLSIDDVLDLAKSHGISISRVDAIRLLLSNRDKLSDGMRSSGWNMLREIICDTIDDPGKKKEGYDQ